MKKELPLYVLYLPRWYPNRYDPMFGLFVQRHAEAAALFDRISVVYAEPNRTNFKTWEIEQRLIENVLTVWVYYPVVASQSIGARFINTCRYFRAIFKGIRQLTKVYGRPQLIHVHILTRLALPAFYYKTRFGIPYLITEHWSRYLPFRNEFKGFFRRYATRFFVRKASLLTTVTENLQQAMQQYGLHNSATYILPNVVDMKLFRIQERKPDEKFRIVHISCFEDRSKNISGTLNVIDRLKDQMSEVESVFIGDGMDFERMQHHARALGLTDNEVRFTGLLEGEKLAYELAIADVLVVFSHYENLPVVILEAFACGVPVIATKVGGIAEIINEENGILIDRADEQALMQAIIQISDHTKIFDKEKIRAMVREINSQEAVGRLLHDWYQRIYS
jgi:glycosyltransferase involved in cell wall biosynthesis